MHNEFARHVDTIAQALFAIKDMCDDPSAVAFEEIREPFERLEAALQVKGLIDAFFAFVAERDDAGSVVGSKWAKTYLERKLGLEPRDAFDRLARGRAYFGEPEGDGAEAREDQEQARKGAAAVSEEKQRVIRIELDRLVSDARGAHTRLLADSMREASWRSVKDLRAVVRRWVARENSKHVDPDDPNAGMENRQAHIGGQKADGTVDFRVSATAGDAALIKAIMDKGLTPNSNLPEGEEDHRTPAQRRYDQFMAAMKHYDTCERPAGGGCASVVVSCTLDQLAEADAATTFQTNTGIDVTAFDLVRLGMDGAAHFVLTVDDAEWVPLNLYRTRRTASIAQRITLLAVQGVCAWTGCTAPLTECEAHHIVSWLQGGNTDISNLAGLCRQHHRMNNDRKDHRRNTSHVDVCPETGRAGVKEPGAGGVQCNMADAAVHSTVNQMRTAAVRRPHGAHRPPPREPEEPPPC